MKDFSSTNSWNLTTVCSWDPSVLYMFVVCNTFISRSDAPGVIENLTYLKHHSAESVGFGGAQVSVLDFVSVFTRFDPD